MIRVFTDKYRLCIDKSNTIEKIMTALFNSQVILSIEQMSRYNSGQIS
jgi:hypothetical protein